jgi:RNA polymerase sigma factor (sigma-70 family)
MPEPDPLKDLMARELEFVVRAAMRIARWYPCPDQDILDLIQEGNLALLQAVNRWLDRPPKSVYFHTFIARRVERALIRCAEAAQQESARTCSLEACWHKLCQIEAPAELEPAERLMRCEENEAAIAVLGSLNRRLRKVVALRCGLVDGRERTYEEIGSILNVSDVRAAQLMAAVRSIVSRRSRAQTSLDSRDHTVFWRVSHNREVDALLVELIDLLTFIRYAHPALVQLELALSEGEETIPESAEP